MSKDGTRDGYGRALLAIAKQDPNVVALDCDLGRSTRSFRITETDPARFIEMGIAEQDMIATAAGLCLMGKIPFVNSFSVFLTGRAFDQIRQQVSLPNANVKLCGSSSGLTQGPDGATHQSVLDVALMRTLPNMTVVVPADPAQAEQAVWAAYRKAGAVYVRLSRHETGDFLDASLDFELGRAQQLRPGKDVAIVSNGPVLVNVLAAADQLARQGLSAAVWNFHTVKPLDVTAARALAANYRLVVAVEEHSVIGGLGSALAEAFAERPRSENPGRLARLGVQDTFGESGTADELLKKHALDPEGIAAGVLNHWRAL